MKKEVLIKLYIGKAGYTSIGRVIELPVKSNEILKEKVSEIVGSENNYIIVDDETEYSDIFYISEFTDIYKLNEILLYINDSSTVEEFYKKISLYSYFDMDIDYVKKYIDSDRIEILYDVEDSKDETLGEKIVETYSKFSLLPNEIREFLNYEKIGNEYYCQGFRFIKSAKTVIRQVK